MERLTNEAIKVDASVDGMIGSFVDLANMKPKLLDVILNGPTLISAADVAPVRRGHWIEENGCQICSECGEEHEWDEYRAAYCDVCGAEMEVDNG